MTIRKILSVITLLAGAYLFWEGLSAVLLIVGRGSPLSDALLQPPTSIIRLVGAALVVIGSLLALVGQRWGHWSILIGTILIVLLAALMAAAGTDISMWRSEAIAGGLLSILTGLLLTRFRR